MKFRTCLINSVGNDRRANKIFANRLEYVSHEIPYSVSYRTSALLSTTYAVVSESSAIAQTRMVVMTLPI